MHQCLGNKAGRCPGSPGSFFVNSSPARVALCQNTRCSAPEATRGCLVLPPSTHTPPCPTCIHTYTQLDFSGEALPKRRFSEPEGTEGSSSYCERSCNLSLKGSEAALRLTIQSATLSFRKRLLWAKDLNRQSSRERAQLANSRIEGVEC